MIATIFLDSVLKRFAYYKALGDQSIAVLTEEQLHWQPEGAPNSIYLIIKHMSGNMRSRWTDFLHSDGEKPWRDRDREFEDDVASAAAVKALWEEGWQCMLEAIRALQPGDLEKTVYIRHEPHTVLDAINRQLAHIPYHVGQIVYIAKMIKKNDWESLSIPKGKSQAFNQDMFNKKQ
ncbi:DUF1572 family protein [Chitinophaga rhizophila]|uniref:DUF1572 domain-containing protein n=1 Tax=Chitinophaga rhizophila TaxID=2866212 RepID=A0ABS7G6G7_9BACT|nr:DUF1572 family protein [Chitinophaga rhizophila]MBW8683239.1 DUF1572 domain-containing protein [Chitinophaga rhizophila]